MGSASHVLAEFRRSKRLSQLDLSLQADVSARHISFIETGRTQPSRDILLKLAGVMGLSHRECNRLMTACGYAPVYAERALDEAAMQPVRQALNIMLDNHDPFPAVVLNSLWDLHMGNRSLNRLMSLVLPPDRLQGRINMMELLFDHQGLRPYLTNWDDVAALLLRRLKLQLQSQPNPDLARLMETLLSMAPPSDWQSPEPQGYEGPMLTSELEINGQRLSVFTTLSSFGTALDVGLEELMIESYFPTDEPTRRFFEALATAAD